MSLDDRIRDGFAQAADDMQPDVEAHLARTRRTFQRRRTTRRVVLAAAAVVVAVLAVPVSQGLLSHDDRTTAALMTDAEATARLQGVWVTPVVSREQVARVLSDAGLAANVDAVVLELGYPTAWNMSLRKDGGFDVRSQTGVQVDVGHWLVDDGVLVLRPTSCETCGIRLAFHLEHGTLRLALISDDEPDLAGVPGQAYARALYTAVPFTRFGQPTP